MALEEEQYVSVEVHDWRYCAYQEWKLVRFSKGLVSRIQAAGIHKKI